MDILDEVVGTPQENVSIDELMVDVGQGLKLPRNSMRNRAATTAMLTDRPDKAVENYTLMMQEADQGQDVLGKQLRENILTKTRNLDMKGVMSILADPSIPLEGKQEAIAAIRQSQFLKDQGNTLFTNSLIKESAGETKEAEDARLSSVDAIREIYEARKQIQGLVNAHAASLDPSIGKSLFEITELYVLPFGNSANIARIKKNQGGSLWEVIKSFAQPGTATANIRKQLEDLPPEKRVEFAKSLVDVISNSGVVFSNDSQFAEYDKAVSIFEDGGYGGVREFLDNVSPLLDAVGIGFLARGTKKLVKKPKVDRIDPNFTEGEKVHSAEWELVDDRLRGQMPESHRLGTPQLLLPYEDKIKKIEQNSVVHVENPASPAKIVQQSNPQQARNIHEAVVNSTNDELAEGLYGTTREQAITSDVFPSLGNTTSKVGDIDRNLRRNLDIPDELVELVHNSGATYYTKEEKAAARANVVNRFSHAEGMEMNVPMSAFTVDGGRVKISAVYGTPEGSFSDPVSAFTQAKLALREAGVLDSEITVLKKEGLDHVPMGMNEEVPEGPGNYLVRVDTYHEFDPTDFSNLQSFDVKRNLFDRIPGLVSKSGGSATRYLFDAASTVHPIYTSAASVVSDATAKFDKFMLSMADEYAVKFNKFPKDRKDKLDEYIREANYNEIKFDTTDLVARGFSPKEIDALRSWKQFWDAHFYLENYDLVRTMNSQGFMLFRNQITELYAKPIAKNQNLGSLYDPATDSIVVHTKADGDALYNSGGTYARLRRPTNFGGTVSEYMIVRNTPNEYLRTFRDTDRVLNYRDGYFQIQYIAPKFVDEVGKDGKVKTVAVAGDTAEAEHFATRMGTVTGLQYRVRGDERALRRGDDSWWDLASASGRIAQRYRGKLLEDASGVNHLGGTNYIINPVDSATRAAKSIAGRTVSRPMLEAAKARFLNQYERFAPSNGHGGVRWPSSVKEIGAKGEHTSKEVADARTVYEYINYLENGYINAADDIFKAGMNAIADMLGRAHLSKAERGISQLGDVAPLSLTKNGVFMAYIGSNPLRQLLLQPHQVVRTFAYNPMALISGNLYRLPAEYLGYKMGLNPASKFGKFVDDSGLLDAVDKSNLVRGTLKDAADSTNRVVRAAGKVAAVPRKAGFDIGEQANLLGHAAAVYDRYTRLGYNLADKSVRDAAYAEIRAISYEMNFAGDMPYNQTTPAMLLQFMQVPHKAFLQMTNRKIPRAVRARLIAGDLIMWGAPTALIVDTLGVDILPDNADLREIFLWGAESWAINAALSELLEDRVSIDFSSLAPYDMTGWGKFFTAMYEGGLHDLLLNSPAGQLFFKEGSRLENAFKSMGRYFGMVEDDDETPEDFLSVMNEVAKISSGYSNAVKAKILLDAERRLDQYGNVIDKKVNHVEAWAQLFGFGTSDTRDLYRMSLQMSKDTKAHRDDVLKVYEDIKRYYTEKLDVESSDPKYITKVTGRILRIYKNDPAAQAIIASKLVDDLSGKDSQLLLTFMRRSGIPDLGGLRDQVKQMPVSDEQKQMMLQRIQDMENARKQTK